MDEKNQLVIAFHLDGTVQHTLCDAFFKPDFGVQREVERMTDIKHERAIDCYYVIGKLDPIKGKYFDAAMLDNYNVSVADIAHTQDRRGVLLFRLYDDAVRCEIRVIDAMRLRGDIVGGETEYTSAIDLSPDDITRID